MSKKFFIGGFVIIIVWAIGFFGFHLSATIHVLLMISMIVFLISLLYNKSLMQ